MLNKPTLPFPRQTRKTNSPRSKRGLTSWKVGWRPTLLRPRTTPVANVLQRLALEQPDELRWLEGIARKILSATQALSGPRMPPARGHAMSPTANVFHRLAWENPKGLKQIELLARLKLHDAQSRNSANG